MIEKAGLFAEAGQADDHPRQSSLMGLADSGGL
jgi:hypothetical protein